MTSQRRASKDKLPSDPEAFFLEVKEAMKKLCAGNLVHGDLSQYNILNWNEKPIIIDMSQATTLENPYAEEYIVRDCRNICNFFGKLGVECSEAELAAEIRKERKKKKNDKRCNRDTGTFCQPRWIPAPDPKIQG